MIIGVPKEIKDNEFRVAIVPDGVNEFIRRGHSVLIEKGAGLGSGIVDEDYEKAGATIKLVPIRRTLRKKCLDYRYFFCIIYI
jgi:alanine dehydrogenase